MTADFRAFAEDSERRRAERKLDFVKWSAAQARFLNLTQKFAYNRAANQSGKSYAAGGLIAYTATGLYPGDYKGWRPKLRTDGAYGAVVWVLSTTGQMVRDGLQNITLGDVAGGRAGTGLIPKDCIVSIQTSRGIAGAVDFCTVRRVDGTISKIAFKTYEQGRTAVQAEPVSLIICDELLDDLAMWHELIARTTVTNGILRLTATERLQSSPVALWFKENAGPDVVTLTTSLDEAEHLSAEEKARILASYKSEAERNTRYYGLPFQGAGSVFETPWAQVSEAMNPATFPSWYKYLIALDFSHFGRSETSSQFACVFMAVDPVTKVTRIYDCFKMRGVPEQHAAGCG
ncbi:MAG: terminase family protein [Verrucomicrobiales bacterium]|nr:terminase family protein [Verrucomicrobiales bacterium]